MGEIIKRYVRLTPGGVMPKGKVIPREVVTEYFLYKKKSTDGRVYYTYVEDFGPDYFKQHKISKDVAERCLRHGQYADINTLKGKLRENFIAFRPDIELK